MYPLDQGSWGPTVRISHLRDELSRLVDLDLISGYRGARRVALARYAVSGRVRGLDGIYVESSSFLPAEADVAFLGLARALGIPILTYIRDAYQLFPEYYELGSLRRRLGALAFRPAMRALRAVSSRLAFPSAGLARAVFGGDIDPVVIPPGSRDPVDVARLPDARRLLFVGNGQLEAQGARRLIEAVGLARKRGLDVELTLVSRPGEEPRDVGAPWIRVLNGEGATIHALLPDVLATVIPRPRGAYNDLAVPVKLFDYLAYGRPLLVTDCTEQAAVVRRAQAGIVTGAASEEIAEGIRELAAADDARLDRWSENARRAALVNSWSARASSILDTLGVPT
ncbi:MAG: glycosyltransferase [Candidatus Limnocylindria bacterium]